MDWFLKFVVIWLSFDIVIIASVWYAVSTIRPLYPNWWRRVIVDDDPELLGIEKHWGI
ncbi:MAG: hypothetical protein OES12_08055 [Anaerolineae bacterium]|jgi:hypothetical protein|nr:hypothetical protein [Anaerolineae bacterium]